MKKLIYVCIFSSFIISGCFNKNLKTNPINEKLQVIEQEQDKQSKQYSDISNRVLKLNSQIFKREDIERIIDETIEQKLKNKKVVGHIE